MNFLIRRESADDKQDGAVYADDLDMIISPRDGTLIPVAVMNGVHVCWVCFEQFVDDPAHKHRGVEYNPGGNGVRILLHAGCVKAASRKQGMPSDGLPPIVQDKIAGHQRRRFITRALKPFMTKDSG
jgi:hypothetical protein